MACSTAATGSLQVDASPESLVATVTDPAKAPHERRDAFDDVLALPSESRRGALLSIVEGADTVFLAPSASWLIRRDVTEATGPLSEALVDADGFTKQIVMDEIRSRPDPDDRWREIPRALLEAAIQRGEHLDPGAQTGIHWIEKAAIALSSTDDRGDVAAITAVLTENPESVWLWCARMATLRVEELSAGERKLAAATWEDRSVASLARFAAALAISRERDDAAAFVRDQFQSRLLSFAETSRREIVRMQFQPGAGDERRLERYRETVRQVRPIYYSPDDALARSLLVEGVRVRNPGIRQAAAFYLARRAPDIFLSMDHAFTDEESYLKPLVLLSVLNPGHAAIVKEEVPGEFYEKWSQIMRHGDGIFAGMGIDAGAFGG